MAVDLVVVGGGPGGLSAAIFAASEGLRTVLVAENIGGQASTSSMVENYLGFPVGIAGPDLMNAGILQAARLGVEIVDGCVYEIGQLDDGLLFVGTDRGDMFSKTVVVATGVEYREIPALPASDQVSYGVGTKSFPVEVGGDYLVYGGGNSAAQAAVDLAERGGSVVIASRSPLAKSVSKYMIDKLDIVGVDVWVDEVIGSVEYPDGSGVSVVFNDGSAPIYDHVFAFLGGVPNVGDWGLEVDEKGRILTGPDLAPFHTSVGSAAPRRAISPFETSIPNVFAIGDVRHGSLPRIAGAVGEGAAVIPLVWAAVNS